jgi:predicted membrane protein
VWEKSAGPLLGLVARVRQLLTVLLIVLLTMIGTWALFVVVVVLLRETMRVRHRIRQRWGRGRIGESPETHATY